MGKKIAIIDDDHIMFQMKRPFKSQKLGSDMTIRHKESMILKGSRYVQCLLIFLNNRPVQLAPHLSLRLFLKPVKGVSPNSSVFYQAKVQGKEFCSKILDTASAIFFGFVVSTALFLTLVYLAFDHLGGRKCSCARNIRLKFHYFLFHTRQIKTEKAFQEE